jgi:hypothetical protein
MKELSHGNPDQPVDTEVKIILAKYGLKSVRHALQSVYSLPRKTKRVENHIILDLSRELIKKLTVKSHQLEESNDPSPSSYSLVTRLEYVRKTTRALRQLIEVLG